MSSGKKRIRTSNGLPFNIERSMLNVRRSNWGCRFRSAVSRILSPIPKRTDGHSFIYPAGAESPPERSATYPESLSGPPDPLFCLAPDWVFPAFIVTFEAVSSYLPFSPLPHANQRFTRGGLFSVTLSVPSGYPAEPPLSRGILPYGVRTFLSSSCSSECPHPEIDSLILSQLWLMASGKLCSL